MFVVVVTVVVILSFQLNVLLSKSYTSCNSFETLNFFQYNLHGPHLDSRAFLKSGNWVESYSNQNEFLDVSQLRILEPVLKPALPGTRGFALFLSMASPPIPDILRASLPRPLRASAIQVLLVYIV